MRYDEMTMHDLQGMSLQRVTLMGLPHIDCQSVPHANKPAKGKVIKGASCCVCGALATNAHHLVPKGMGGGSAVFLRHIDGAGPVVLTSPLLAVCGGGNTSGCHERFHIPSKAPSVVWVWDSESAEEAWQTGKIWNRVPSNSPSLYRWGHWEINGMPIRGNQWWKE